jgi:hypothetical protein
MVTISHYNTGSYHYHNDNGQIYHHLLSLSTIISIISNYNYHLSHYKTSQSSAAIRNITSHFTTIDHYNLPPVFFVFFFMANLFHFWGAYLNSDLTGLPGYLTNKFFSLNKSTINSPWFLNQSCETNDH